jgi:hypothetical protein
MMKKLNETPGKNPFRVPDNYFEEVNRKIISSAAGTQPETVKRHLYRRLRPFLVTAASVAVFVLLGYTALKIFLPENKDRSILEISIEQFSESYLNDIDIPTLEENADLSFLQGAVPALSKTEIIDYLLLENINLNEIYELL